MGIGESKEEKVNDDVVLVEDDDSLSDALRTNLTRLIAYAKSADPDLQRQVAEKLANEAVKPSRQAQIVELGGLKLLLPLANSRDIEVQRLAVHALANLSVDYMLGSNHPHLQRQAAKALANLGVNTPNKDSICTAGGVPPLVQLASSKSRGVAVEAVAALANLAVNGGSNRF
eukprot:jgi/Undpi1/1230/HiC_scaffold_108.g14144.m1